MLLVAVAIPKINKKKINLKTIVMICERLLRNFFICGSDN